MRSAKSPYRLPLWLGAALVVCLGAAAIAASGAYVVDLDLSAALILVVGYLVFQGYAVQRLIRYARIGFSAAGDGAALPPFKSRLVARELAELRDVMQRARLQMDSELARNKELWQVFRSATSTGGDALVIVDAWSRVLLCNERVELLLRRPLMEVTGQLLRDMLASDAIEAFDRAMQEFRRIGRHPMEGQAIESAAVQGDGHAFPLRMMVRTVSFGGAPCLCISMRELTEEKLREQLLKLAVEAALKSHAVKTRFLANMSHELRTPLNGITGMTDVLALTRLDAHQQDLLGTLASSTRHLRKLLDDILDLSKIDSGALRMERRPFDLDVELGRVAQSFGAVAAAKGLLLRYEFDGEPRRVVGDSYRLAQVLSNLLDNAIKFTPDGTVTVRASVKHDPTNEERCRVDIEVRDTGPGIAQALQDRLFAAFTQADDTTTRRYGGTGLGLALSRELCQAMEGEIAAQSTPGGGATFRFHVHLGVAPHRAAAHRPAAAVVSTDVPLRDRHVLVADDNPVNRKVLEHMLVHAGMHVEFACDGAQAVASATAHDFDLVLMDVSMPLLNGYDATRAIRALTGSRAGVPIIGVTALAMEGDHEQCLAAGMDAVVLKPIARDNLFSMMRNVLRGDLTPSPSD